MREWPEPRASPGLLFAALVELLLETILLARLAKVEEVYGRNDSKSDLVLLSVQFSIPFFSLPSQGLKAAGCYVTMYLLRFYY